MARPLWQAGYETWGIFTKPLALLVAGFITLLLLRAGPSALQNSACMAVLLLHSQEDSCLA
jgi:hypothetical protein